MHQKKSLRPLFLLLASLVACTPCSATDLLEREDVRAFVAYMVARHGFDAEWLRTVFREVRVSDGVLKAIARPAEVLPWYKYREIFVKPDRVELGVRFWEENREALDRARRAYGVPEEYIVAIIGVETRYGKNAGAYKVIDALATLAFEYPPRGEFFRDELEQYLLLTREQGFDPTSLKGSYAGAMGIPQFISSSYRRFAVDFDIDGVTDIWGNTDDAIGSVANYFHSHGWRKGGPVALPAERIGDGPAPQPGAGLEPDLTAPELEQLGIRPAVPLPAGEKGKLLALELEHGTEYWLGLRNFYVITRYNRSPLYAMAVFQLAQLIRGRQQEVIGDAR
jgi:membrane-bound lytic murein transglycosylase B